MAETKPPIRREFEANLVARASADEAFANELRRDPRGVVQREMKSMGISAELPANVQVTVIEETPATMYLVLPRKRLRTDGVELSDEDLEKVAGGGCIFNCKWCLCGK